MPLTDDPKSLLERILTEGLARVAPDASGVEIRLERPRNPEHGDYSCNAAMQLARVLKRKPREIAQLLLESVRSELAASLAFEPLELAGAGFINARLSPMARAAVAQRVLAAGAEFVVMICGDMMTMPGLPKVPSAEKIDLGDDGRVVGLF